MKLCARFLAIWMATATPVAGTAGPADAMNRTPPNKCPSVEMTASECKTQLCDKHAATNHTACSELPSNASCEPLAKSMRHGCYQSCDETHPAQRDPKAQSCKEEE